MDLAVASIPQKIDQEIVCSLQPDQTFWCFNAQLLSRGIQTGGSLPDGGKA